MNGLTIWSVCALLALVAYGVPRLPPPAVLVALSALLLGGCEGDAAPAPRPAQEQPQRKPAPAKPSPRRPRHAPPKVTPPPTQRKRVTRTAKKKRPPTEQELARQAAAAAHAKWVAEMKSAARAVAKNVAARRHSYDRALLKRFQVEAGLEADGVYGGGTAGAVKYFLGSAPRPLFKPTTIQRYEP